MPQKYAQKPEAKISSNRHEKPGKFAEISEVLGSLPIKLLSLKDLNLKDEVEEHGLTHEENAILKAQYFFEKTGLPTLGEDSGIHVDAFPGELGVQTRRWGGLEKATDEGVDRVFSGTNAESSDDKRGAKFVCFAALILGRKNKFAIAPFETPSIFSGETRGIITKNLEAPLKHGIPISSCFKPEGFYKVYAALTVEEKNKVSHRGKAMHKIKDMLKNILRAGILLRR